MKITEQDKALTPNCNFINESEVPPPSGEYRDYEWESAQRRRYIDDTPSGGWRNWTTDRDGKVMSFSEFSPKSSPDQHPKDHCVAFWSKG